MGGETASRCVVFVEAVGLGERLARLPFATGARLGGLYAALLSRVVGAAGGRTVKTVQGTALLVFPSPSGALTAAMALVDCAATFDASAPETLALPLRIGMSFGEVRLSHKDVFGEPVNLAARVLAEAAPGEIWLSDALRLAMPHDAAPLEVVGARTLKGIPEPVRLHRVARTESAEHPYRGVGLAALGIEPLRLEDGDVSGLGRRLAALRPVLRRWRRPLVAGAAAVVVVALVALLWPAGLPEAARRARALVADGNAADAVRLLSPVVDAAGEGPEAPALHAALAHAYVAEGRPSEALPHFDWVADTRPSALLPADLDDLAGLVARGGGRARRASAILRKMPSRARDALRRRLADPKAGPAARLAAADLLVSLGGDVDRVPLWIAVVDHGGCDARLAAVRALRAAKDARALPALRRLAGRRAILGLPACGSAEAGAAVAALGGRTGDTAHDGAGGQPSSAGGASSGAASSAASP